MGKYMVIVSGQADQMLVSHVKFLAQVSISAAKRLTSDFGQVLKQMEENPYIFPIEEDYNLPRGVYRKAVFSKRYKILFLIIGDSVYIDAVIDCRQDNSRVLN